MTSVSVTTTKNTVTVNGETRVVTVKTRGPQGPSLPDGDKGDVTVSSNGTAISINNSAVTSAKIADEAIVDADINASAAIALSKLATGALPTAITVTSANISDLSIVNADINASAAIQGTKISPNFGSQNIVTTGTINATSGITSGSGHLAVDTTGKGIIFGGGGSNRPSIIGTYASSSDNSLALNVTGIERLKINADGTVDVAGNLDVGAGLDVTGNISVTGTVDGRDVATDGTKLDTLSASTIQNGTSFVSVSNNADITISRAGSTRFTATGAGVDVTGDLTITNNLTVTGNFTVNGTTTTIDTTTLTVEDKNIELGKVSTPTDTTADGGGITLKGATDKTFQWLDATDSWTSSEHIALPDNKKLQLGASQDLQIYHDGNHSKIVDSGPFATIIQSKQLNINNAANSESLARLIENGVVELYYDNSHKFSTNSGGITVHGSVSASGGLITGADNAFLYLGAGNDLQLTHNGTDSYIRHATGSGQLQLRSREIEFKKSDATGIMAKFVQDGAVELYHDNEKKLFTKANGIQVEDTSATGAYLTIATSAGSQGSLYGTSNTLGLLDSQNHYMLKGVKDGAVELYHDNSKKLETVSNGNKAHGHYFTDDGNKIQLGTSQDLQIYHDGSNSYINNTFATGDLILDSAQNFYIKHSGEIQIQAVNDGAVNLYYDSSKKLETTSTGISVTGNITVSGTVDGRDLATDGTKLDGIESNATADQTASEIVALVADQTIAPSEIDMEDNEKIKIGTGDDLQIYHDGDNSYIIDIGTGSLILGGDRIRLRSSTGEDGIEMLQDGAVELYYDNSKKLETTSTGTKNTGVLDCTGSILLTDQSGDNIGKLRLGNDQDLEIYHDGTDSFIDFNNALKISDDTVTKAVYTSVYYGLLDNYKLNLGTGLDTEIYHDGTDTFINQKINALKFNYNGTTKYYFTTDFLTFQDNFKAAFGTSQDLQIYHDGSNSYINENGTGDLIVKTNIFRVRGTNDEAVITGAENGNVALYYDSSKKFETTSAGATVTGDLSISSTTPILNLIETDASSDYRLLTAGNEFVIQNDASGSFATKFKVTTSGVNVTGAITGTDDLTLTGSNKKFISTSSSSGDYIRLYAASGTGKWDIYGNGANLRFSDNDSAGSVVIDTNLDVGAGLDVTGGITGTTNLTIGSNNSIFAENNLRFKSAGDAYIDHNTTGQDIKFRVSNSSSLDTTPVTIQSDGQVNVGGMQFYQSNNAAIPIDNAQLRIGAGDDLKLYHDGSHSVIKNETGSLYAVSDTSIILQAATGGDVYLKGIKSGAVELYYGGSRKFQTNSLGAQCDGDFLIPLDNEQLRIGGGSDLRLYHDGTNSVISNATGTLFIAGDIISLTNAAVSETYIKGTANGAVELFYDNEPKILTKTNGATVQDLTASGAYLDIKSSDGVNGKVYGVGGTTIGLLDSQNHFLIKAIKDGAVELYYDGNKKFETISSGAKVIGELYSDGLRVGDNEKIRLGDDEEFQINHDGNNSKITHSGSGGLYIGADTLGLQKGDHSENYITMAADGAVELYYDNAARIGTASYGVNIIGDARWGDNRKATFGNDGTDLQIYHDSSTNHSFIKETGTGSLVINANDFYVQNVATETMIKAASDGAVELYYDSSKKFETTSYGAAVTGGINFSGDSLVQDNVKINFGAGNDLQIYHDGSNSIIGNSTGVLIIASPSELLLRSDTGETMVRGVPNGAAELYYDNVKKFETTSTGINVTGHLGINTASTDQALHVIGTGDDTVPVRVESTGITSRIGFQASGTANSYNVACGASAEDFTIHTGNTERMRVDDTGRVMIGTTSNSMDGVNGDLNIANDNINNNTVINCSRNTTNDRSQIRFSNPNGNVGSITTSASATSFNTSSDYRLKENEVAISDGITRLKQLKAYKFNFKTDSSTILDGFFAHEVSSVVPQAITGTKDAVVTQAMIDAGDFVKGTLNNPIYQSIDHSKLVPLLVAAVQELIVKVEALEAA